MKHVFIHIFMQISCTCNFAIFVQIFMRFSRKCKTMKLGMIYTFLGKFLPIFEFTSEGAGIRAIPNQALENP